MSFAPAQLSEIKVEDNDEFRIKSEPENVHLVMENDEHRKGYEFEEFCMKMKLEHLCLGTTKAIQDDGIVRVETVFIPRQLLLQALGQLQNSQNIEVRLKAYNTVIKQSKLLLVLTTKYENHFSVNPDEMTPNDLMIGSLAWYRGILGIIGAAKQRVLQEARSAGAYVSAVACRLEGIFKIKENWQNKAQYRYPSAQ